MRFTRSLIALGCVAAAGAFAAEVRRTSPPPEESSALAGQPVEKLIEALSDDRFKTRELATRAIWELADAAAPALREAIDSPDPERAHRAREVLRKIELHITPATDPGVVALVENYQKATAAEKVNLMSQMRDRRAWRQILKLFASETSPSVRDSLASIVDGVAAVAARERLIAGDSPGAKEFLEMAPVDHNGLTALAAFHRAQGTLAAELERAKTRKDPTAEAWMLALHRAAGDSKAALEAAEAAGEPVIAAAMAALAGDPLPWLRHAGNDLDTMAPSEQYAALALRRWQGKPLPAAEVEPFRRLLASRGPDDRELGARTLILLGEVAEPEARMAKDNPQEAFLHFDSLERLSEALRALGLDPVNPDFTSWVAARIELISEEPDDEVDDSRPLVSLLLLANFLERRGLHDEAFAAFGPPLLEMAANDRHTFTDFLGSLFSFSTGNGNITPAALTALRIGAEWAADHDDRWQDLLMEAMGEEEMVAQWWKWLEELKPDTTRTERFAALLALFDLGPDPQNLRHQWMQRVWEAVENSPENERAPLLGKIGFLTSRAPDAASSLKTWELADTGGKEDFYAAVNITNLTAADRWHEAAEYYSRFLENLPAARQATVPESYYAEIAVTYAHAAAAMRQAGRHDEAAACDAWVEKLALGDGAINRNVSLAYSNGRDYTRAALWLARAAHESDLETEEFGSALKAYSAVLLQNRNWQAAAATAEVSSAIAGLPRVSSTPLGLMQIRVQADLSWAMANLETNREAALARLQRIHQAFSRDGSLADHFFPALREAGLMKEHDEWFEISWNQIEETIAQYPGSDNTRNTAGWLASRARLRLDEAEEHQKEALRIRPNQAAYLDTMAEIHFARGNREEAIRWSKQSLNFDPRDSMIRQQYDRFLHAPLPQ